MNRRRAFSAARILLIAILPVIANTAAAQRAPALKTPQDLEAFTVAYYQHPQPEFISRVIDAMHLTGILQDAFAAPPTVGFFSEVFAANPSLLPKWQAQIKKQDEQTKAVLQGALSLSQTGGVLKLEGHSPTLNDMYWGAFFATGNSSFLRKLVDQLRYFDERDDLGLFVTGASAKWALASNAQSHPLVYSTLKSMNVNTRTQELIEDVLTQGAARIQQETAEILKKQKDAGKWK